MKSITQKKHSRKEIQQHIKNAHEKPNLAYYLREIAYGGNDGIVTTFAVVAGFSGASIENGSLHAPLIIVLLFGIANILGDGVSMGLGNFLSMRAERDAYLAKHREEEHEIQKKQGHKQEETMEILRTKGFTKEKAAQMTELIMTNKKFWTDFMLTYEHHIHKSTHARSVMRSVVMFLAFIVFGSIALVPYLFLQNSSTAFLASSICTFLGLTLLGFLRWHLTKLNLFRALGETILIGGLAACVAFIVGTFFR